MLGELEPRSLRFFDEKGVLLGPMSPVLFAFVLFPEDQVSRAHVLQMYEIEQSHYSSNPSCYEASEVVRIVLNSVQGKAGQRVAAGLMMLAFQHLFQISDEAVSLYQAAQLVERALEKAKMAEERPLKIARFDTTEPTIRGIRLPSSRRDIEKAYQTHQSVAHILAADLLSTNSLELSPLFERTFEVDAVLLNTISQIERVMVTRQKNHFQNPWLVTPSLNDEIRSCGHVLFEGEFLDFLLAGQ